MVVIGPDRDLLRELGQRTEVVAVPMGRDVVIDPGDARVLDRVEDAARIASRGGPAVARVDENGLAGWRHEERGVAALDVDDIDVQGAASLRRWKNCRGDERYAKSGEFQAHINLSRQAGRRKRSTALYREQALNGSYRRRASDGKRVE
jgi:hypothetical protein